MKCFIILRLIMYTMDNGVFKAKNKHKKQTMKKSLFKFKGFREEKLKMLWKTSMLVMLFASFFNQSAISQACIPSHTGTRILLDTIVLPGAGTTPYLTQGTGTGAGTLGEIYAAEFSLVGACGGPLSFDLTNAPGGTGNYTCANIGIKKCLAS